MTSQADFDRFVESQRSVRVLALRDLSAWWETVEGLPASSLRSEAEGFVPILSQSYGEVSSVAAADFYDAARGDSGARGTYRASLAPSGAADQAARQSGWALAPLWNNDLPGALSRIGSVVDAAALQDGRDTVIHNSLRDRSGPRWARVPVGKTCAWCLMLASRGAVYRSADTAGRNFHSACDCQPTPSWDQGRDLPPSYDGSELYELYARARERAGSGDPKAITAAYRRLDGGRHVNDGATP